MVRFSDISGIVMAAGSSSRMEGGNKLLLLWGEQCVVQVVVERVCEVGFGEVVVVTGHQREEVEKVLGGYSVRLVHNPGFAEGMAFSIKVGVEVAEGGKGYLFALGDMPKVRKGTMESVAKALDGEETISVPVMDGRRGNPVAIGAAHREELLGLEGDRGARSILQRHADRVVEVTVDDEGIFVDMDTREAYRKALEQEGS
jgi:molybdenum cofactor cytidylyltransferase